MKKFIAAFVIVAIVLSGVGGYVVYNRTTTDTSSGPASVDDAVQTNEVSIQNFKYSPTTIKVEVGTTVTWTNKDTVQHNVLGDSLTDLNGPLLDKGKSFTYTFTEAGTYGYHCAPHPYMKGTVVVLE